ncbi:hypothetical protein VTN77DRAFT_3496 [Rasamsonia byssochlamydoides]|uniref:uncharacterized protein n=1 Tax=Rasamsonia byssochlamydoides TaxID=89139 RepID=UPI0037449690
MTRLPPGQLPPFRFEDHNPNLFAGYSWITDPQQAAISKPQPAGRGRPVQSQPQANPPSQPVVPPQNVQNQPVTQSPSVQSQPAQTQPAQAQSVQTQQHPPSKPGFQQNVLNQPTVQPQQNVQNQPVTQPQPAQSQPTPPSKPDFQQNVPNQPNVQPQQLLQAPSQAAHSQPHPPGQPVLPQTVQSQVQLQQNQNQPNVQPIQAQSQSAHLQPNFPAQPGFQHVQNQVQIQQNQNQLITQPQQDVIPADEQPLLKSTRGRALTDDEALTLFKICLAYRQQYLEMTGRKGFWIRVSNHLAREIKRLYSWHSCQRTVNTRSMQRRQYLEELPADKRPGYQSDLNDAIDEWITVQDQLELNLQLGVDVRPSLPPPKFFETPPQPVTITGSKRRREAAESDGSEGSSSDESEECRPRRRRHERERERERPFEQALAESITKLADSVCEDTREGNQMEALAQEIRNLKEELHQFRTSVESKLDLIIRAAQRKSAANN